MDVVQHYSVDDAGRFLVVATWLLFHLWLLINNCLIEILLTHMLQTAALGIISGNAWRQVRLHQRLRRNRIERHRPLDHVFLSYLP